MTGREGGITGACDVLFACNVKFDVGISSLHLSSNLFVFILIIFCSVRDSSKFSSFFESDSESYLSCRSGIYFLGLLRSNIRQLLYLISVVNVLLRVYYSLRDFL